MRTLEMAADFGHCVPDNKGWRMRIWGSLVLAIALLAASSSVAKEPLKPPFAGHPDCRTSGRYYRAVSLNAKASQALQVRRYAQSYAYARKGVSTLGDAYWSDDVPVADDTGMYLVDARVRARRGDLKGAAKATVDMLDSRIHQYLMVWGDPAKLCNRGH